MKQSDIDKWGEALNSAHLGDVITINDLTVKVEIWEGGDYDEKCRQCPFYERANNECFLTLGDFVLPCSFWNNSVGRDLKFIKL